MGKPRPILLGPLAIWPCEGGEYDHCVVVSTPIRRIAVFCTDADDANKVCRALRNYVEIVDVSLDPADIENMIRVVTDE